MALSFDKIVLFGDSITQLAYQQQCGFCFGSAIQHAYCRKLDVILRGFGGYNSDHAAAIVDALVQQETSEKSKIKLMVVFFGTNDSIIPESRNHVPVARFKDNLRYIISVGERTGAKIVVVGPGPFNHYQFIDTQGDRFDCDRCTLRARQYCDAAMEVAEECNVAAVPLWDLIMADLGWKEGDLIHGLPDGPAETPLNLYLNDGVHYLGKAYEVEFLNVIRAIKEHYPELDYERIPEKLPKWEDLTSVEVLKAAIE
ncbi:SGNH hydrolase-type esterase domain-containing protein [Talaromyces proteolyticus]|uniref:SGNH hydrolase-type esterase domain-containing protein n=1 Tax=Talaromyces proteolyticus TaxID=1131652 RepID=A0AAD4PSK3_9EURO|nr:SGNH hydrolase-type esterase domain-containing protein [Talaromyces proteolyticus]KAH8691536.1 SGNH hydrolase-type esterase domain-containing protein [Talaromyces proteolyticus]